MDKVDIISEVLAITPDNSSKPVWASFNLCSYIVINLFAPSNYSYKFAFNADKSSTT